jgi:hypothetical protein
MEANDLHAMPKGFDDPLQTFHPQTCAIPRLLHQTWKTDRIPFSFGKYVRSWVDVGGVNSEHGGTETPWQYYLWTDKMSRHFVATRFPQHLSMWDALPQKIMRADLLRYMVLYDIGGVYADLDFQALQPLDTWLPTLLKEKGKEHHHHSCVLGQEPLPHAHVLYKVPSLVCNAIMMSCPHHPFWLEIIELIRVRWKSKQYSNRVLKLTGPMVVQAALDDRRMKRKKQMDHQHSLRTTNNDNDDNFAPVYVAPPFFFYPDVDYNNEKLVHNCNRYELKKRCQQGLYMKEENHTRYNKKALSREACRLRAETCAAMKKNKFRNSKKHGRQHSLAVHHWKHSWLPGYPTMQYNDAFNTFNAAFSKRCLDIDVANVVGSTERWRATRKKCGYNDNMDEVTTWRQHAIVGGKGGVASGANQGANQGASSRSSRSIPMECQKDRVLFCSSVSPGKGRTHACLHANKKHLSMPCFNKLDS